jgi:mycothiol S-conjugate amidase
VIAYDEDGGYPHPDHLRVHEITVAAFAAAGDPVQYPGAGPAFAPSKLYYTTRSKARLVALAEAHERAGLESPFKNWIREDQDDSHITTRIDVGEHFEARRDALLAHATQVAPDSFWMRLPLDVSREAYPHEDYTLAFTRVPVRLPETDLFTGIPG